MREERQRFFELSLKASRTDREEKVSAKSHADNKSVKAELDTPISVQQGAVKSGHLQEWVLDGIVVHGLQQADLQKVAERLDKAGLTPHDYLCAELHREKGGAQSELNQMLARKAIHEQCVHKR